MDDEEILSRGGTEEDIKDYAEANGANLTKDEGLESWEVTFEEVIKGLKIKHNISKRLFVFMYYEITMAKKKAKEEERERIRKELPENKEKSFVKNKGTANAHISGFYDGFNDCLNQVKKII